MAPLNKPGKFDNMADKLKQKAIVDPIFAKAEPVESTESRLARLEAENKALKAGNGVPSTQPAKVAPPTPIAPPKGLAEKLAAKRAEAKSMDNPDPFSTPHLNSILYNDNFNQKGSFNKGDEK